jgi:hypothetical protein
MREEMAVRDGEEIAIRDQSQSEVTEAEPIGQSAEGAGRTAAIALAVVAVASISVGAWLRLRRS